MAMTEQISEIWNSEPLANLELHLLPSSPHASAQLFQQRELQQHF